MATENVTSIRRRGLGGSEAAAAMGLSRWQSPLKLWMVKMGLAPETEETEAMRFGKLLEVPVVEEYVYRTQRLVTPSGFGMEDPRFSVEYPFMFATPDRYVRREDGEGGVLEVKTTGAHMGFHWDEEPPVEAQIQLMHYLAVTGRAWGSIVGLIGGQRLVYQDIERNEMFIQAMIEAEATFWSYVERGVAPPASMSVDVDAVRRLHPRPTMVAIGLPLDAIDLDAERQRLLDEKRAISKKLDVIEAQLTQMIGDAEAGTLPDGSARYEWTLQQRKPYSVEAGETRVLRRKKQ